MKKEQKLEGELSLKVLKIITNLNSGGAQKLLKDLVSEYKKSNISIGILVFNCNPKSTHYKEILDSGVLVYLTKKNLNWSFENIKLIKTLANKYDVIHCHLFQAQYQTAISKIIYKFKTPILTTEHSTFNRRRSKPFNFIERVIYRQFDISIAISEAVNNNLRAWLGNSVSNIITVYNGINFNDYNMKVDTSKFVDLSKQEYISLTMIGRFVNSKNQKMILDAIAILPSKYHLTLVGDGENLAFIKSYAKFIKVSNRVAFEGHIDDVFEVLKKTDIYIQASNWEGFGLSVLEAMLAGKPVISTDVEGLKELVDGFGIIVKNNDYIDLSNKIIELEKNAMLYNELSKKSICRVKEYDMKQTVSKYISLYKEFDCAFALNRGSLDE